MDFFSIIRPIIVVNLNSDSLSYELCNLPISAYIASMGYLNIFVLIDARLDTLEKKPTYTGIFYTHAFVRLHIDNYREQSHTRFELQRIFQ